MSRVLLTLLFGGALLVHPASASDDPRDEFFEHFRGLCGAAFTGQSSFPDDPEDAFYGKPLVAEVISCSEAEVRVAFAVGEDRSRTWVLSREQGRLRLRHDHRHADGTPDEITLYGGWATEAGTRLKQSFPADTYTQQLIPAATTNVWTLSFDEEGNLTYYLERHSRPRFKAVLSPKAP